MKITVSLVLVGVYTAIVLWPAHIFGTALGAVLGPIVYTFAEGYIKGSNNAKNSLRRCVEESSKSDEDESNEILVMTQDQDVVQETKTKMEGRNET
jgi:uncharacterized alpha/beta hydrolase family protein